MNKITPHLWFDKEAKEATEFYTSVFPDSKIDNLTTIQNTPSGDCDIVSFTIFGMSFMAISAGPLFKFNPSISFHIKCKTKEEVDEYWNKLIDGGKVLMELGTYPFSERYGWLEDKFGLSWQIIHSGDQEISQKIVPVMMFTNEVCGKAEEAINFYTSLFDNSETVLITRYGKDHEPDKEGSVMYAHFKLDGQEFGAMDSAHEHKFSFNETISFIINCDNQEEIDHFWEKLSAVPESEQCGWLKDKFGLSWQVTPKLMGQMMEKGSKEQIDRVTQAFLKMKKFDLLELQKAYDNK